MKPRPCCDRRGFEGWTGLDYYSIMQLELCGFWARKANSTMFRMLIQSVLFEFNRLLTQILNTAVSSSWHHYSSSDVFTKSPIVNSKIFPRHQPISHGNRWIDHKQGTCVPYSRRSEAKILPRGLWRRSDNVANLCKCFPTRWRRRRRGAANRRSSIASFAFTTLVVAMFTLHFPPQRSGRHRWQVSRREGL